jgi:hypothetical protein
MTPTKASQSNTDFTTLVIADSNCLRETALGLSDLLKGCQALFIETVLAIKSKRNCVVPNKPDTCSVSTALRKFQLGFN